MHPEIRAVLLGASLVAGLSSCGGEARKRDLTFMGSGYSPLDGQTLHMAVLRADTGEVVARKDALVSDGSVQLSFPDLLEEDVAYRLDYYVDLNGNGQCDAPPTDAVWRTGLRPVAADMTVQDAYDTRYFGSDCSAF
jgi:hypothetical protein